MIRELEYECDLCGQKGQMQTLRDHYATPDVYEICDDCAADLNKRVNKATDYLLGVRNGIVKRFITGLFNRRRERVEITKETTQ